MKYVWGICPGWDTAEVLELDEQGVFHRIAHGPLKQKDIHILGPVEFPQDPLGSDVIRPSAC